MLFRSQVASKAAKVRAETVVLKVSWMPDRSQALRKALLKLSRSPSMCAPGFSWAKVRISSQTFGSGERKRT